MLILIKAIILLCFMCFTTCAAPINKNITALVSNFNLISYQSFLLNRTIVPILTQCDNASKIELQILCLTYYEMLINMSKSYPDNNLQMKESIDAALGRYTGPKETENFCSTLRPIIPKEPKYLNFSTNYYDSLRDPRKCQLICEGLTEKLDAFVEPICKLILNGYEIIVKNNQLLIAETVKQLSKPREVQSDVKPAPEPNMRQNQSPQISTTGKDFNQQPTTPPPKSVLLLKTFNRNMVLPKATIKNQTETPPPIAAVAITIPHNSTEKLLRNNQIPIETNEIQKPDPILQETDKKTYQTKPNLNTDHSNENNKRGENYPETEQNTNEVANAAIANNQPHENDFDVDIDNEYNPESMDENDTETILQAKNTHADKIINNNDKDEMEYDQDTRKEGAPSFPNTIISSSNPSRSIQDPFMEGSDSNFFTYFMSLMLICIILYVAYHNKTKVIALMLEGRRSNGGRSSGGIGRRKHTAAYRKLDANLEEAITSNASGRTAQIIY